MSVRIEESNSLKNLRKTVDDFLKANESLLESAAGVATEMSRDVFRRQRGKRPSVDPRRGRPTTQGRFESLILWRREGDAVGFDSRTLEDQAPYWLIQEIGTGEEAVIRSGSTKGILGTETDEGGIVVSIPSQIGRRISKYLTWAGVMSSGTNAQWEFDVPRHSVRGTQQLTSYREARNAPLRADLDPQYIGVEIEGKHFIKRGGEAGNAMYQASLLELAQASFEKKR